MATERDLETWISISEQHRQSLKRVLAVFTVLAFFVTLASHRIGLAMFAIDGVIAVAGFWILAGHISDWRAQLARRRASSH